MYHEMTFKKLSSGQTWKTWESLHLIPSSRPDVSLPERVFKYVDIPGRDDPIDMTNYLIGRPYYSGRSGQWEFLVVTDQIGELVDSRDWITRKNELLDIFDGSEMEVILSEDDPTHKYKGRIFLESWQTGDSISSVTIQYRLDSYKYLVSTGEEDGI